MKILEVVKTGTNIFKLVHMLLAHLVRLRSTNFQLNMTINPTISNEQTERPTGKSVTPARKCTTPPSEFHNFKKKISFHDKLFTALTELSTEHNRVQITHVLKLSKTVLSQSILYTNP
ncbi:hypothetical protein RND81_07G033400 [Saponaria officinalis]|uniref:Uncharacterized protein n=1 Tax=Saponaria officinalis TaxID=3572 RepID=A0AAW1JLW7_SAPOF